MEKVSIGELNKIKNELVELEENIGKFKNKVEELKKNDFVMSYIDADHEYQKSLSRIKFLKSEIPYQKMLNCDHYFVINEVKSEFDGHRTDRMCIVTCIRCGLTNKYIKWYQNPCAPRDATMMNEVFMNCDCYYWPKHGYYSYDEIPELKQIYDKFVDEYPQAIDKDIENHIALVKKMKEGKSC